jgi:hypothetical protein
MAVVTEDFLRRQRQILKRIPGLKPAVSFVRDELLNSQLPLEFRAMRLLCRSDTLRKAALTLIGSTRSAQPMVPAAKSALEPLDVASALNELDRDGLALNTRLLPETLANLITVCEQAYFVADVDSGQRHRISLTDDANPSPKHFLYCLPNPHETTEVVQSLAHDPQILSVVSEYLKGTPVLMGSQIWWSYPHPQGFEAGKESIEYGFHYDIDDYKFIKVFFYLRDVGDSNGPHVMIRGTHRKKTAFEVLNRRIDERVARRRYADRIVTMTGRAGMGFFEDTFCYHRGESPRQRRLALELEYGLFRYGV